MGNILLHPGLPRIRRKIYKTLAFLDRLIPSRDVSAIFAYHSIGSGGWRFSVAHKDFCTQVECLLKLGYMPVSVTDIVNQIRDGKKLLKKSFAITFDDGYRDVLLVKHFLAKRGIRPTVFVLAEPEAAERRELGTGRQFLSTIEILELQAAGWEIGCHSATHADFSKLDAEALEREVVRAKSALEERLGLSTRYFAYPKGFHDEQIRAAIKRAGYVGALSMDDGFIGRSTDVFAIPRIGVDRTHTVDEFAVLHVPTVVAFRKIVKEALYSAVTLYKWIQKKVQTQTRKRVFSQ